MLRDKADYTVDPKLSGRPSAPLAQATHRPRRFSSQGRWHLVVPRPIPGMAARAQNPGVRFAETQVGEHELSALGSVGAEKSDKGFMFQREGALEEELCLCVCCVPGSTVQVNPLWWRRIWRVGATLQEVPCSVCVWDVYEYGSYMYNHEAQSTWTTNDVQTDVWETCSFPVAS